MTMGEVTPTPAWRSSLSGPGAGCLGCGGRLVDWHPLEVSWILFVFGIKINLWEDIALR